MRRLQCGWPVMVGAVAALLVAVAGCSAGKSTGPDLAKDQVLRLGLDTGGAGDIATLDPNIVSDAGSQTVVDLLYDPLVTLDPRMAVENWGAERVTVSNDGLTYTFHLRAHQGFADGTPVTAADYAYSMNRALSPCVASPVSYYLFQIKDAQTFTNEICQHGVISRSNYPPQPGPLLTTLIGDSITAPDPATLVVRLAQPAAYFLTALTYPVDAALNPAVIGADVGSEGWVDHLSTSLGTNGMFALSSWDHAGGQIVLKPNPHWWGLSAGKKPYLSEIDFILYRDSTDTLSAYQSGKIDLLPVQPSLNMFGEAAPSDFSYAQTLREFHRVPVFTEYAIIMDWTKVPFNNQDAREALCLAVNRDVLNQQVYGGQMLPTWHIVPSGMPGYNPSLTGPDGVTSTSGDPTSARTHWQAYLDSLHGDKPPTIGFSVPFYGFGGPNPDQQKLAEALEQQWKTVLGITVKPTPYYVGLWDGNTHIPLGRFGWQADYPDPQDFLSLLLTASSQYNPGGVNVPEADQLTQQADIIANPSQRYALYAAAEQLYVNAVAWCPLFQGTTGYVAQSHVHGWQMDGRGLTPDDAWLATYVART